MEADELDVMDVTEQLEAFQWVLLRKKRLHLISLPEMALLAFLDEWLAFARAMTRELAA